MAKSSAQLDLEDSIPTVDYAALARAFNKPVKYVEAAVKFHGITELPRFRTPDDGLGPFYSDMTATYIDTPSRTKQEFTKEVDINNIMKRFEMSGYDPTVLPVTKRVPLAGDFTQFPESYHAALNFVNQAHDAFMELPAELRARFENDPQQWLKFVDDPANEAELIELGLVLPAEVPALSPDSGGSPKDPKPESGGNPAPV